MAPRVLRCCAAACASDPARLAPGTSRADALQQLGTPTAVYQTRAGERLQYSRAVGYEVNNIDLDSTGRVVSVRQELNEGLFGRTIQPGVWREADILQTYGRPLEITRVTSFDGVVWTWRYKHINARRLLYIYVDRTGMVSHYNVGDDLMGDPDQRS
ncbi:MAG: hypothetical protein WKG52_09460 [Variovorax sp.]